MESEKNDNIGETRIVVIRGWDGDRVRKGIERG
jgi:hypothetical protein